MKQKTVDYYDSKEFKEKYLYGGDDLGAVCGGGGTCFKLWSPLAEAVTLNLYTRGKGRAYRRVSMKKEDCGVWSHREAKNCHGVYYDFFVWINGEAERTADPYARACSCNGTRSMVVELERTNPKGWEDDRAPEPGDEQIIYEVHVKDFSYDPASGVPKQYRGKYKAFTLQGTTLNNDGKNPTCLDYLKKLGITHVQLMPVFDFATVDEAGDQKEYNWGYDPLNFNVPEGSYATDPFDGTVRIRELKELVMALHQAGIRVIMDVVYNHTYSTDSWFNKTVPGYFYRRMEDGSCANGSACGNDLASEREMCGKYILESVLYWAGEYHMDGFRFDLMGLLDVDLMNTIRNRVDELFGKGEILLYGEPWRAADSPMRGGALPCLEENLSLLDDGVGVFCDKTRDVIKGHVFKGMAPGFVNGGMGLEEEMLHSVCAWTDGDGDFRAKSPRQVLSYISAHDNLTLWDKLKLTLRPREDYAVYDEKVVRANKMAAAVYFTCLGKIFFLSGEEAARTKEGNSNSFISPPELNKIDWGRVYEYEELLRYYKGLIAFRKRMPGLYDKSREAKDRIFRKKVSGDGCLEFCVNNRGCDRWDTLFVGYNSTDAKKELSLPEGEWELLLDTNSSFWWEAPRFKAEGSVTVEPVSVAVFGRRQDGF